MAVLKDPPIFGSINGIYNKSYNTRKYTRFVNTKLLHVVVVVFSPHRFLAVVTNDTIFYCFNSISESTRFQSFVENFELTNYPHNCTYYIYCINFLKHAVKNSSIFKQQFHGVHFIFTY